MVRAVTLPVVALAGLVGVRLTVSTLGVDRYAVFALVVGLAALIPVGDLGVGAAVTDAVARRRDLGPEGVQRVLRTSLRVLVAVALALSIAGWILAALGWWAPLLGVPHSGDVEVASGLAVMLYAAGLPMGLSRNVLLGAERNDIALVFQAGSSVLALIVVLTAAATHAPLWAFAAAPSAGAVIASAAAWPRASAESGLLLTETVLSALLRGHPGARIAHLAGPMLVITTALPIAYQSDRLLLSHLSNLGQVAVYAVAAQIFGPLLGLVGAAGISLWPLFARRRANQPVSRHELIRLTAAFTLAGALLAIALVVAGPRVAQFVSTGKIYVGPGVFASFGLLLVVNASWWPTGMLLTDRDGLRFQALCSVFMVVINVVISAALAQRIGAAGPVLGSVMAIVIALLIPGLRKALIGMPR